MTRSRGAKLLDQFLKSHVVRHWAYEHGFDETILCKLRAGRGKPSLEVAAKLSLATSGAVPMESWIFPAPRA